MSKNRLTFFENIYYWLWYYLPKKTKYWDGSEPAPQIGFLFALLRFFNLGFLAILFHVIFRTRLLGNFYKDYKMVFILVIVILGFIIVFRDERNYTKKIEHISEKINKLTPKERTKKNVLFFLYIILSIGFMFLISSLESMYRN